MNSNKTILIVLATIVTTIIFSEIAYTNNNGKAGFTGSPGENACNNCHNTNPLNSGGGSVSITSPNMPNWTYFPGTTYTINVRVKKTGLLKFGFGFEALLPSGANGGLILTASSANAKTLSATVSGNSRTNAVHKQPSHFGTDSLVFSFEWTAPTAGTGNVTFYASGNATNSLANSSGDFVYTTNQLVTEATTTAIQSLNSKKIIAIYPNPTSDFINLSLPETLSENTTMLQIFDISGKLVHAQNLLANNSKIAIVDIQSLQEGIYFANFLNGNWEHQEKFMVAKQ